MKRSQKNKEPIIILNKKARHNYQIQDQIEAGIALEGSEVKSIRNSKVNLSNSFATFKKGELFLTNMRIEPYHNASFWNHEPTRPRKLLLKRKEIDRLSGKLKERGFILVPLKLYFKNQLVKILLGLGKGKKLYDRRRELKEKEMKRDLEREFKKHS